MLGRMKLEHTMVRPAAVCSLVLAVLRPSRGSHAFHVYTGASYRIVEWRVE